MQIRQPEALTENEWVDMQSSFIDCASCCIQSRIIAVRLKTGEEIYFEIRNPRINVFSVFSAFLKSRSKGQFFNKVLRQNPVLGSCSV